MVEGLKGWIALVCGGGGWRLRIGFVRRAATGFSWVGATCDDSLVWRELIDEACPGVELAAPANEATIVEVEKVLSLPLPFELASLLGECNGVHNQYGDAVVWPAERLIEDNLAMRADTDAVELYAPFDELIFFGDTDMGPQFAYAHTDYGPGIILWDQETDQRRLAVVSLRDYLVRCLTQGNAWFRRRPPGW